MHGRQRGWLQRLQHGERRGLAAWEPLLAGLSARAKLGTHLDADGRRGLMHRDASSSPQGCSTVAAVSHCKANDISNRAQQTVYLLLHGHIACSNHQPPPGKTTRLIPALSPPCCAAVTY